MTGHPITHTDAEIDEAAKTLHLWWAAVEAQVKRVTGYASTDRAGLYRVPELTTPDGRPMLLKEGVTLFHSEIEALWAAITQGNVKRDVYAERILACANRLLQLKEQPCRVPRAECRAGKGKERLPPSHAARGTGHAARPSEEERCEP